MLACRVLCIYTLAFWLALVAWGGGARAEREYKSTVSASDSAEELPDDQATSSVKKRDLDFRLPRSAPDALRYEPGVFVQQSAHGQGSAFIRGLTGQQTLMLFDGIRLNNSTYRQGPNQYFFTVDARTIRAIDVERGGGSTRWGSDAFGGVIDVLPLEPSMRTDGLFTEAKIITRYATADNDIGGRLQLDISGATPSGIGIAFLGGIGGRDVGLLSGPPVLNPNTTTDAGYLPWVPRYKEYNPLVPFAQQPELRTQLGTGFQELAGDLRLVIRPRPNQEITVASYVYREYNAPRTDQCAPPSAPYDQCTTYEHQDRTLVYGAWKGRLGRFADRARVTLSWQEQHEQRRLDLTTAHRVDRGSDYLETWGVTARATSDRLQPASWLALHVDYGADSYFDWLRSGLYHFYTDLGPDSNINDSRGQYLNGSTYFTGGAYGAVMAELGSRVTVRGGARVSWVAARAPEDPQSGSKAVNRSWVPVVGHIGVEVKAAESVRLFANYDNSYRAPNLDDMTARQQTGPGFQFENAALEPEHSNTLELGGRLRTPWVVADAWLFETLLDDLIIKVSKLTDECPPSTPQCQGSWSRFQLQNSPSMSELRGAEGAVKVFLPEHVSLRATAAYVWSEGPRVGSTAKGVFGVVLGERVPLSRTPPLNGTVELAWKSGNGFSAGAALQWATEQTRLSIADYSDGRIPKYGTPGFAVVSLRASYKFGSRAMVTAVVENLLDSPYRFHGSSVNGAGRGMMLQLEMAPFF